jgi:hypothetical protein
MTTTLPSPQGTFASPPAVNLSFVLVDQTTGDRPDLAPFLPKLRDSLDEAMNEHFAPFHGGTYALRVAASPSDRKPGEIAINIRHQQTSDPQGALAWHQVTGGIPDIEINLDSTSGLTGDSDALDVCGSHEVMETAANPGANLLADNLNGKVSAREACDRIEDTFFTTKNGLHASNFLIWAAWVPGAAGPYDYMMKLSSQLDANSNVTMTAGGYDIEGTTPSDLADVTPSKLAKDHVVSGEAEHIGPDGEKRVIHAVSRAPISGKRLARKQSRYSRAYRQGVRL